METKKIGFWKWLLIFIKNLPNNIKELYHELIIDETVMLAQIMFGFAFGGAAVLTVFITGSWLSIFFGLPFVLIGFHGLYRAETQEDC